MHYLNPQAGVNAMTTQESHPKMKIDTSLVRYKKGQQDSFFLDTKECVILLQSGKLMVKAADLSGEIQRGNVFDDPVAGLHVPCSTQVTVEAMEDSECLVVSVENETFFAPVIYSQNNVPEIQRAQGLWNDTACRIVRTMCDYSSNPKSMLAFGETINYPGKWSGIIPHMHQQPELYFYRFNKPQGFGAAFYGDNLYLAKDYSYLLIEDPLVHPQAAAPGYAMYYFWVIRHFENDPWIKPTELDEHQWLNEPEVKIWPEK